MIFGVFDCSSKSNGSFLHYKPVDENSAHISSFQVKSGAFVGGYLLNNQLPYGQHDVYYTTSEITVLFREAFITGKRLPAMQR